MFKKEDLEADMKQKIRELCDVCTEHGWIATTESAKLCKLVPVLLDVIELQGQCLYKYKNIRCPNSTKPSSIDFGKVNLSNHEELELVKDAMGLLFSSEAQETLKETERLLEGVEL